MIAAIGPSDIDDDVELTILRDLLACVVEDPIVSEYPDHVSDSSSRN